jgi:hypothetical protein
MSKASAFKNIADKLKKTVEHTASKSDDFFKTLESARKDDKRINDYTHLYTPEEYAQMKTFLSPDGKSGFAIKPDGDIVSAFSSDKGGGRLDNIMKTAISHGGTKLDAFDKLATETKGLPDLYSKHGFKEVKREPNWTKGDPDVVYMENPQAKLLKGIDTPEKAVALTGKDREAYLKALEETYGNQSQRAKDMGFGDKTMYHGTANADIESFLPAKINSVVNDGKPGSYFTPNPESAAREAFYKADNVRDKKWSDKLKELEASGIDGKEADEIANLELQKPTSGETIYPVKIRDDLSEKFTDWGVPSKSVKVQNPGVRSTNAAFDPRFKDSDLILAAKEGAQGLGNILHKLGAPQRKVMNYAAEQLGVAGNPEESEESSRAIVQNLADRAGLPEDSSLVNAGKALGVAGLEVFGDPLNAVPGFGMAKKISPQFNRIRKAFGK